MSFRPAIGVSPLLSNLTGFARKRSYNEAVKKIGPLLCLIVPAAIALAWQAQSSQLYINGNLASSGMIERNGVAYVPLKDVAATFKLSIQKTPRGYELSESGGANQVEGQTGKIGDMLFNGFVRFQVVKVAHTHTYICQFDPSKREIDPIPADDDLLVIVCKLKNGTQKTITPDLADEGIVAVTDAEGHSYAVRRFGDFPSNRDMLPGAAIDYALVFNVPPSFKPQDLVYGNTGISPAGDKKRFRISLATP